MSSLQVVTDNAIRQEIPSNHHQRPKVICNFWLSRLYDLFVFLQMVEIMGILKICKNLGRMAMAYPNCPKKFKRQLGKQVNNVNSAVILLINH